MKKIWFIFIAIMTLVGCANQNTNDRPSSYDGDYYSYTATVKNTNDVLFTIENGSITGKIAPGVIDEKTMTFTDSKKLKSAFIYDNGELIIKTSEMIKAYRKNSPAYKYINEIYGKYYRDIEPQLTEIINQSHLQFLTGIYTSQSPDLDIHKLAINNNQLSIHYRNNSSTKQLIFNLESIKISEPNWDKDQNLSIDETLLKEYEKCSTIEDIMAISNFDIKLTGKDEDNTTYNIVVSYNNGNRKIVLQKQDDSKNNWIDSYFDYTK